MLYNKNFIKEIKNKQSLHICSIYDILTSQTNLINQDDPIIKDFLYFKENEHLKAIDFHLTNDYFNNQIIPKSMDLIIGIIENKKIYFVLIELKFNIRKNSKKLHSLNKKNLEEKVNATIKTLNTNFTINNIFPTYYFVFKQAKKESAILRFNRMIPQINKKFIPIGHQDIQSLFFA